MTAWEGFIACGPPRARLKPGYLQSSHGLTLMVAIGVIALFLIVFSALNKFEFGRFD